MRSSRLVELMLRLEGSRGVTAGQLAEELGVSVRTVYRDVTALSAAGVPLWTESGPGGGIRLLDGWQSKLGGMTGAETSALMLLGVPSLADDLGLREVTAAAQSKLLHALPVPLRAGAQLWRDRLYVDVPGWFTPPRDNENLPDVAAAVLEGRRLRIDYRKGADVVTRTLDPLGLVAKAGVWYLVAQHRSRTLSYRVSRISDATALTEQALRPEQFDLGAWWSATVAEFDRAMLRFRCRVRLSPRSWRQLPRIVGVEAARVEVGPPDEDGWVAVDLVLEAEDVALEQLTALGAGVEVLAPASLRAAMRDTGEAMMNRHR
ncbi:MULTISPECIES: YafY family protein [Rhodococcus]|uniref:YafY family protein n=1 Tax=Rhodococcus oxybenzonivorans TaxID=1990687 RepID=A0AAE5A6Z4_9NOCA|nr:MULTISPECIES: YafY family protein [Rhodococcus]MDV7243827.1 YafY family protein [Rhodococcus oxybenzonivorans]MDV7266510.1 YafY family protein [Rhodococcus oxybenzonivorans]MDV7274931.1 YafY family protein [Rhodococcus oxybenzonivorans]MDV7335170.1 YafY family protein [Rhodococcus oxybenzonivorans]MDV7345880.1 YafY family protein [Rhodococcus oxybenzonivorans]